MMRHLKCIFETALALKLVLTNTSLILPNTNNFCLRLHPSSTFQFSFSFTELCSDYKINYYQLFFDILQLMPTPTMSCSKTRGLPGLPPIPTGEIKEQSALYEVVSLTAFIRKIYDLSPVLAVTLIIATSNANVVTSEHWKASFCEGVLCIDIISRHPLFWHASYTIVDCAEEQCSSSNHEGHFLDTGCAFQGREILQDSQWINSK